MKKHLEDKALTTEHRIKEAQRAVDELIPLFPHQTLDDPELALVTCAAEALQALRELVRGSEPAWMQDIRLAQRHIDAARVASRKQRPDQSGSAAKGPQEFVE